MERKFVEKYIYHITTITGHVRKSPRSEISPDTVNILRPWIKDLLNGQLRAIFDTKYTCRTEMKDSKMCEFVISKINENFKHMDLIRFVVCRNSQRKASAWALVGGQGDPPDVPFCAVQLINDNIQPEDLQHFGLFADFERCIAWSWLDYRGLND